MRSRPLFNSRRTPCTVTVSRSRYDRAIAHLRKSDPVLKRLIDANPSLDPRAWLAEFPRMDHFGALIFQVFGQQISVKATRSILGRLQALFGGALPTPAQLLAASPEDLRKAGMSNRKVATVRAIAERFVRGEWSEARLSALSDLEVEALLTQVSGVGPWTVHGFLIVALDRDDVVLPGDLALRKSIQRAYRMDHLPSQKEVLQLAERWRPWRSLATAYLFQAAFGDEEA